MKAYAEMTKEELQSELDTLKVEFETYERMDLHLDMSRGKPCRE